MRTRSTKSLLSLSLAFGLVACGGGGPADELAEEQAGVMLEMAGIVEGISNGEDLEDAKSEMKVLADKLKEISQRWAKLQTDGVPVGDIAAAADNNPRLQEAIARYSEAMRNLMSKPELAAQLGEVMAAPANGAGR